MKLMNFLKNLMAACLALSLCACTTATTTDFLKWNQQYVDSLKGLRDIARSQHEVALFEISLFEIMLGDRIFNLPHSSYIVFQKAIDAARAKEPSDEQLAQILGWKAAVLSDVALEFLKKYAPDVLQALMVVF